MTREPLTPKQRAIFDFIATEIREKHVAPSMEEIGLRFGLRSLASSWKYVDALREKGYIRRRSGCARSITIVHTDICAHCGSEIEHKETANKVENANVLV